MTQQDETRRKSRRDLLLILLILPFGVLCMFMAGQAAIRLAPNWVLPANMLSNLDPNSIFAGLGHRELIEPLNPGILTQPAWDRLFLTPNATIPTREVVDVPTSIPVRTVQPPPEIETPLRNPSPTATLSGPIVLPTVGSRAANLGITKTDSSGTYTPGTTVSYTIVVNNNGPDSASRFNIQDNVPASITGVTVTCRPSSNCGTNNSSGNNVFFEDASLAFQAQFVITVSGIVSSGTVGNLSNTAEIVIPSEALIDDYNLSNNSATDTDTRFAISDLAITKSDGSSTYTTTNPISYTIVVTNSGPSDALGVRVVDNIPDQIAFWTWTCTSVINASGCSSGAGASDFTDTVNIQNGGRIEYTVAAYPTGVTENVSNTASILLPGSPSFIDPNTSNNTATDTDIPYIDLQIAKTDGGASYSPNGTLNYTVTVTNNSSFNVTGIIVSDSIPTEISTWDWSCASANPSCDGVNNSNGDFTDTIDLAAMNSLVYNVTADVSGTVGLGGISNTATVSVDPLSGLVDADPSNNSATETTPPYIDLQITKTDNSGTYTPGVILTYEVTVTNNSAFDLNGITVTDTMPALISSWTWTCGANPPPPGGTCDVTSGTGSITNNTVNLPAGASVIYTIDATVNGFAIGTLENTASVSPPAGVVDLDTSNNTATDSDANALGGPNVGLPDGSITMPAGGTTSTYFFSPAITNDGTNAPDFVFYERDTNPTDPNAGIALDIVQIYISTDGVGWTQVFYWGDANPDLNSNVSSAVGPECGGTEYDDCPIPSSYLYTSNGLDSGITIDIDSLGLSGSYPWIQFICPTTGAGNTDNQCDIDAIQPYYP